MNSDLIFYVFLGVLCLTFIFLVWISASKRDSQAALKVFKLLALITPVLLQAHSKEEAKDAIWKMAEEGKFNEYFYEFEDYLRKRLSFELPFTRLEIEDLLAAIKKKIEENGQK